MSKSGNHTVLLYLVISISLISCSDGDINLNLNGGKLPPPKNTDFKAEEPFSEEAEVGNRSQVRLQGVNGEITVTGMLGASSVMITGTKRVGSDSTQDAEQHLQDLAVNVQSLADEIFVETIQPQDTAGRSYVVDYTITMPNDLEIQIANVNGVVTVDAIDNDVTVNNVNGNVTLTGVVGSASVDLVNGTIESEVTLPPNGSIGLKTVNGNIDLAIPANTSASFSAAVNIGNISVSNLVLQNEVGTSTSLTGTLGNGQGMISLEAEATGSITVLGS